MKRKLILAAMIAYLTFLTATALSQIYTLMPDPKQQFSDANGAPISGGKLYTCQAGMACAPAGFTTQLTYTTYVGNVANANPVVLDSSGRANVFISSALQYRFVLTDSTGGTTYFDVDGVRFAAVDSVTGTANQIAVSASTGSPVFSLAGPHNFTTQTQYGVVYGNGTSALASSAAGIANSVLIGTPGTAPSFSANPTIVSLNLLSTVYASLGSPSNGNFIYCSNCTKATPCAAGGTGALAKRLAGAWDCN